MRKDATGNGLLVQEVPEGMVVTEEMGLSPALADPEQEAISVESAEPSEGLDEQEIKGILEALLHVSHEPLTLDKLVSIFEGQPKVIVQNALRALQHDYDQEGRGLKIAELSGGFVMVTRPDCAPWIARLAKAKPTPKVSRSALETLAIVAYRQPLVRSEIEQIRGVETSGVLRTLLDQKLLRIVGRKDVPGRPMMYGTTKQFLQRFGLKDLKDLPPLREFKELGETFQADLFDPSTGSNGAEPEPEATLESDVSLEPEGFLDPEASDEPEEFGKGEVLLSDDTLDEVPVEDR
jgi:segregation and condensation protein B